MKVTAVRTIAHGITLIIARTATFSHARCLQVGSVVQLVLGLAYGNATMKKYSRGNRCAL
jgi:hypothetical protein